ncbi:MAG: glycosyltransferase [Myxococcota bacterium]|nr:glycosyltransferase [Myxococcota bacterium]
MTEPGGGETDPPADGRGIALIGVVGTVDRIAGAQKAYWSISSGLRDIHGFDLVQVAQLPPSEPVADGRKVSVLRSPERRGLFGLGQILELRRILYRVERPAVLFPFQLDANILAGLANALLPPRLRLPMVANERANIRTRTALHASRGLGWLLRISVVRPLGRWCYRRADLVICNTEANAEQVRHFIGRGASAVQAIANPVPAREIQTRFAPRDRSQFISAQAPVIMGHGRLNAEKGWETLIRALARVHVQFPGARLKILGEGDQLAELKDLAQSLGIQDRCDFPGFISDPLPDLEGADVYVLASRSEGMPNSLLEAMALGLPCVSTDCPTGPAEILGRSEEIGRLVPVDDVEAMASTLLELLGDGSVRQSLGRAARDRAQDFEVEACVKTYAEVVCATVESKTQGAGQ